MSQSKHSRFFMANILSVSFESEDKLRAKGRTPLPSLRPQTQQASAESPAQKTSPSKEIACDVCGKVLSSKQYFNKHKRMIHSENRCHWSDCGEEFNTKRALYKHIHDHQAKASVNDEDGELICHWPGCSERASSTQKLYYHLRVHQTARVRSVVEED
ncbi:hypothetical protein F5Y13DRAFT_192933 [Hypoxylon sp. FL1857]|nr:hypothetical protein F5Y13DRAFT_192933 [Hypoxylon sp. FL1857]